MVFILECVGERFTAGVAHDDFDALIMLEGWADVRLVLQKMNILFRF
jgi:hypothetical protein